MNVDDYKLLTYIEKVMMDLLMEILAELKKLNRSADEEIPVRALE